MTHRPRLRLTGTLLCVLLAAGVGLAGPAPARTAPAASTGSSEVRGDSLPPFSSRSTLPARTAVALDAALVAGWAGLPGGAVAGVWVPGEGRWVGSVGLADIENGRPMVAGLQVPIGSTTKTFTGTLVLQEVQRGRLSLDDRLDRWYPQIPQAGEITIAMLLNMSSGIADFANGDIVALARMLLDDPKTRFRPDELIAMGAGMPRAFEAPGTQYSYSNTNTVILGRILEKVTGQRYEALLRTRLFDPLGLDRTFLDLDGRLQAPHAQTYSRIFSLDPNGPPFDRTTDWSISWAWSAGALASTIGDLRDWGRTLGTGRGVLSPATAAQRLADCTTIQQTDTVILDYCLGLVATRDAATGDVLTIWHNGEVFGAVSYVGYYPVTGAVVAVQGNSDLSGADEETIAMGVKAVIEASVPELLGLPRR